MTYWLGEQENIAPGLSRAYESLLDKARELGFKIITAAPNITYDAEEMFYRKLNEVMPGRVADYNKKYGFNPSMEVGEQWAAEIMEQVQVEYLKRIIKDTDSSIAQALESIPHNKKAVLLTGSNHIIRDGGAPLLKLSRKKITTVMVFDAPIAMRDGLVGKRPGPGLEFAGLLLKIEKQLQGALIQTDPYELFPTVKYPDDKVLDRAIILNY